MEEKANLREQGKLLLPKLDVVFHALIQRGKQRFIRSY